MFSTADDLTVWSIWVAQSIVVVQPAGNLSCVAAWELNLAHYVQTFDTHTLVMLWTCTILYHSVTLIVIESLAKPLLTCFSADQDDIIRGVEAIQVAHPNTTFEWDLWV